MYNMFKAERLVFFIAITFLQVLDVSSAVVGVPQQPSTPGTLPPHPRHGGGGGHHRQGGYRLPTKLPVSPQPRFILPPNPLLPPQKNVMLPGPGATRLPGLHGGGGAVLVNYKMSREEQEYLDAHNAFRDKKQVPHLAWDPNLVKFAKTWATTRSQDCNWGHHSNGPYGENIMWELYDELTPRDVVNKWAEEENNWDHTKHACKCQPETKDCKCSHYVAMVWKTTHRVGCATVTCDNEKGILIVCEYDPKGQWLGMNPLNPHK
ncbi:hypothetical protein LguiA_016177 [Lonicera macranthoides]